MKKNKNLDAFAREVITIMPIVIREFVRREDNELMRGQISFPQMITLHAVIRTERVRIGDVARMLSTRMSSATVLVERLIRDKMLSRTRDRLDRRIVWLHATSKARRIMKKIMNQKRESIKVVFGSLTDRERRQYVSILRKVMAHLTKDAMAHDG